MYVLTPYYGYSLINVNSILFVFVFHQYLGNTTPPVVKDRIKELLYSWKVGLPHEAKINEAYLMLKREGVCMWLVSSYRRCVCL